MCSIGTTNNNLSDSRSVEDEDLELVLVAAAKDLSLVEGGRVIGHADKVHAVLVKTQTALLVKAGKMKTSF